MESGFSPFLKHFQMASSDAKLVCSYDNIISTPKRSTIHEGKTFNQQNHKIHILKTVSVWQTSQDCFISFILKQSSVLQFFFIQSDSRLRYICFIQTFCWCISLNHFHFDCLYSNCFQFAVVITGIFGFKQWNSAFHKKMNMFVRENMTFDSLIRFYWFYWNSTRNRANMMIHILLKNTVIVPKIWKFEKANFIFNESCKFFVIESESFFYLIFTIYK